MKGIKCSLEIEKSIQQPFSDWALHVREGIETEGVDYLLDIYERVVSDAKSNQPYGYDEYVNDVSTRQALKIILDNVLECENSDLFDKVDKLDQSLKETLRPLRENELPSEDRQKNYPQEEFWWMYGLPKCVEY